MKVILSVLTISIIVNILLLYKLFFSLKFKNKISKENTLENKWKINVETEKESNIKTDFSENIVDTNKYYDNVTKADDLMYLFQEKNTEDKNEDLKISEKKLNIKFSKIKLFSLNPFIKLIFSYALVSFLVVLIIAIIKLSLPSLINFFVNFFLSSYSLLGSYGIKRLEPLYLSAFIFSLLTIILFIYAKKRQWKEILIGSYVLILLSMLYGSFVISDNFLAIIFIAIISLVAMFISVHRKSLKKLWLLLITSIFSIAVIVFSNTNTFQSIQIIYLLFLLVGVLISSALIIKNNTELQFEDTFFIASSPLALSFLIHSFSLGSKDYTIGYILLIFSFSYLLLSFFVFKSKYEYFLHSSLGSAILFISGMYYFLPSLAYNFIFLILVSIFVYLYAKKGYDFAYVLFFVAIYLAIKLTILFSLILNTTFFNNMSFWPSIFISITLLYLTAFIYRGRHLLMREKLNHFCVFAGILSANLVFALATLTELRNMKNLNIINFNQYSILSFLGLILYALVLFVISFYRKSINLFLLGIMFFFGALAKFYILDLANANYLTLSYINILVLIITAVLIIFFPDYKKHIPIK